MKNSVIVEYEADDPYEYITRMFDTTKYMAKTLGKTIKACQNIITTRSNCKGYKYERVWFNRYYEGGEIENS